MSYTQMDQIRWCFDWTTLLLQLPPWKYASITVRDFLGKYFGWCGTSFTWHKNLNICNTKSFFARVSLWPLYIGKRSSAVLLEEYGIKNNFWSSQSFHLCQWWCFSRKILVFPPMSSTQVMFLSWHINCLAFELIDSTQGCILGRQGGDQVSVCERKIPGALCLYLPVLVIIEEERPEETWSI